MTSTRRGPTLVSMRSTPRARDARTTRWCPSWATSAKASAVPRLGYWPMPRMTNTSSSEGWQLK